MTSSASPASVTAAVRSSSPHGESSELTRVQNWVPPKSAVLADLDQPGPGGLLVGGGHAVLEVGRAARRPCGAMSGTLATILGLEAGKKWIIRDGRTGISRSGSGAPTASGRKKSLGLRIAPRLVRLDSNHFGVELDSSRPLSWATMAWSCQWNRGSGTEVPACSGAACGWSSATRASGAADLRRLGHRGVVVRRHRGRRHRRARPGHPGRDPARVRPRRRRRDGHRRRRSRWRRSA